MDTCINQSARQARTHTSIPTFNANVLVYAALAVLAAIGAYSFTAHQATAAAPTHHAVLLAPAQFPAKA